MRDNEEFSDWWDRVMSVLLIIGAAGIALMPWALLIAIILEAAQWDTFLCWGAVRLAGWAKPR